MPNLFHQTGINKITSQIVNCCVTTTATQQFKLPVCQPSHRSIYMNGWCADFLGTNKQDSRKANAEPEESDLKQSIFIFILDCTVKLQLNSIYVSRATMIEEIKCKYDNYNEIYY